MKNQKTDFQWTEIRNPRFPKLDSEIANQKSEFRNQKSEIGNRKSEIRNQKSEIRNQKSEIRNQKSEIRNQKSEIRNGACTFRPFHFYKNQKSKIKNVKRNFQLLNWIKIKKNSWCSVFVSFVQNKNKETYTVSVILIFELSILKRNQKPSPFSQLLWMSKDIVVFFLSLVLKTWIYRTQYRDQNINNRNRILISVCTKYKNTKQGRGM